MKTLIFGLYFLSGVICLAGASFSADLPTDILSPETECYEFIMADWMAQDSVAENGLVQAVRSVVAQLPEDVRIGLQAELDGVGELSETSSALADLYNKACTTRRRQRLSPYLDQMRKIAFSQNPIRAGRWKGPGHGEIIEGKGFEMLIMDGIFGSVTHLMPEGQGRDIDISFDGKKALFAWRPAGRKEVFHLYEMDLETKQVRQITDGKYNDIEPIYLQTGDILFHSERHVQNIDCTAQDVYNIFACDAQGRYIRRLAFDQVSTCNPVLMPDGRVLYARWDYADKSHGYAGALFTMYADGTRQEQYYNNNSLFPTSVLHPRPIPGSQKILATITGYHTSQAGEIAVIDNRVGMQNGAGLTFVAPVRRIDELHNANWGKPVDPELYEYTGSSFPYPGKGPVDRWTSKGAKSCFPFPLGEEAYLAAHCPKAFLQDSTWMDRLGIYFLTFDGDRELLFFDPEGSCEKPICIQPRDMPPVFPSNVDYRDSTGLFTMANVYEGEALKGITPGTIKRLRVVGLHYRPRFNIGKSSHFGPVSDANYVNPISTANSSYDAKIIVGETPVHEDGSAAFYVPARLPVYFQVLDSAGQTVQTMRTWATLQPGESFACTGCHDSKVNAPIPPSEPPIAMRDEPRTLEPFYGPQRGFSYPDEIQPIWDEKCVSCHNASKPNGIDLSGDLIEKNWGREDTERYSSHRKWCRSYVNLTEHERYDAFSRYVNWFHAEDCPLLLPPYRAGSCKSMLVELLEKGHEGVTMTKEEMDKIKCWIDLSVPHYATYADGVIGHEREIEQAFAMRDEWEEFERKSIEEYIAAGQPSTSSISRHGQLAERSRQSNEASLGCFARHGVLRIELPVGFGNETHSTAELAVYTLQGRELFKRRFELGGRRPESVEVPLSGNATEPVVVRYSSRNTAITHLFAGM